MKYLLLLLVSWLLLAGCALPRELPPPTAGPLDSTIRAQTGLSSGKIKFTGPVTFQIGGSNNVATTLAKAQAPVATAPGASAGAVTRRGLPPWALVAGGLVLLGLLLAALVYRYRRRVAALL